MHSRVYLRKQIIFIVFENDSFHVDFHEDGTIYLSEPDMWYNFWENPENDKVDTRYE